MIFGVAWAKCERPNIFFLRLAGFEVFCGLVLGLCSNC